MNLSAFTASLVRSCPGSGRYPVPGTLRLRPRVWPPWARALSVTLRSASLPRQRWRAQWGRGRPSWADPSFFLKPGLRYANDGLSARGLHRASGVYRGWVGGSGKKSAFLRWHEPRPATRQRHAARPTVPSQLSRLPTHHIDAYSLCISRMANQLPQKVIAEQLDRARRDLLDLGLRNALLNYRTPKTRGVEVVQRAAADVFTWLVKERRELPFVPLLDGDGEEQWRRSSHRPAESPNRPGLPANATEKALQARLLATYYAANAHIEERGANILFVALGMLHWFEADNSGKELRAPLLLVPVELKRTSAREKFKLSYNEEDLEDNLSLATKVATEFHVKFPAIPDVEDLDVNAYFRAVAKAVRGLERWRVEPNEIRLGMFSFGKFLMYRDLEPGNWCSQENPDGTPTLAALLRDGFGADASVVSEDEYLDEHVAPDAIHQVVDLDSSQAGPA